MEEINTEELIEALCYINPDYDTKDIELLENKFNCKISCYTEKHNSLQHTYFYEIDFNLEHIFYVEIESGINNGTVVNHADWDFNTMSNTKTIEVLTDIILDEQYYKQFPNLKQKAEIYLTNNKSKLFDYHRINNYDNYVTGGNSKLKLDVDLSVIKLDYIYEEKEVDCNFI